MTNPFEAGSDVMATRDQAQSSAVLGIIAMSLCLLAFCSSCTTLLPAIPVAMVAIHQARSALAQTMDDDFTRALGRVGMATGLIALIYALILLLLAFAYVMLYVVMFAGIILAGI